MLGIEYVWRFLKRQRHEADMGGNGSGCRMCLVSVRVPAFSYLKLRYPR